MLLYSYCLLQTISKCHSLKQWLCIISHNSGVCVCSSVGTWTYSGGCSQLGGWLRWDGVNSLRIQPMWFQWLEQTTCISILRAGFMGVKPVPWARSLMLCCHYLEILNNFILNLCFLRIVHMDIEGVWAEEIGQQQCSLTPHLHVASTLPREDRIMVGSWSWEFSMTPSKYTFRWANPGAGRDGGPIFRTNQNVLGTHKGRHGIGKGTLSYPVLLMSLPWINQPLTLKITT